ncbi:23S rRNA (guanine(2445)-N(2))-methyltransferase [hydrothermal vent metagenome]|uniref:23S rRNA (Guanine(2445)-N(2))-methyltransferase n=1 Tax=hydrothermal vent metagenome TaxID=652676 RepID=A0A3B0UAR2_9ZZZZ
MSVLNKFILLKLDLVLNSKSFSKFAKIKKMNRDFKMVATTMFGFEELLVTELKNLGAQDVEAGVRSVSFKGDKGFMYKANLALRTAIRILKPIKRFRVADEDDLYKKLMRIEWENYLSVDNTFSIGAVVNSNNFTTNSHYIALKSKDAIADYFRNKYHKRPNVDVKHPDLKIHVHIQKDFCSVSLDSSGDSLHKRGYRSSTNIAPINEVLAAGLVLLSGYTGDCNFIDPMCGSGTILIEAAMIANNIPANINRKEFGFEKWIDYDEDLFFVIQDSLLKKIRSSHFKIMGFDKAPSAIRKAKENIENANLEEFIGVHHVNFFNSMKEVFGQTTILFNPPYGERLNIDVQEFYKKIGDTLKQGYPDSTVWFITSDFEALKYVGLRTSRKIPLKNGDLNCKFVRYDMYAGSKKAKKRTPEAEEDL